MVPPHLVQPGSSSAQQPSTMQSKALNYSNNVTQQASALGLPPANFTQWVWNQFWRSIKLSLFTFSWHMNWAPKHHKQWHLTTAILIIAPWWLSARHSFIDAKCRPWSHKSDKNPPEGDTKPPGVNNPWELLFSSSIRYQKPGRFEWNLLKH